MPYKLSDTDVSVDTPTGAAWAEKYLHPPSQMKASYAGIPDLNSTPSVNLEYRIESEQLVEPQGNTLFVIPPSVFRPAFKFGIAGTSLSDRSEEVPINPNVTIDDFARTSESFRMGYKSTTFYQDSTAFNNNGMIYTAQFRPNVTTYTDHDLTAFKERFNQHKGYGAALKHFEKQQQNDLDEDFVKLNMRDQPTPKLPSAGNALQVISLGRIPMTGGEVLMKSPKSTTRRAVEGAFVVQQFSEPTQRYVSLARHYTSRERPATQYSIFCYYEFIGPDGRFNLASFRSADGGQFSPDTEWYDMTWAFVMVILPTNGSGVQNAPVIMKTITGIDVQPVTGGMLQSVVKESPLYDMEALRLACMLRQRMPDSLPASANDFGSVAATVMGWAPKIWGAIKSIFGSPEATVKKEVKKEVRKEESKPARANVQRAKAKVAVRRQGIAKLKAVDAVKNTKRGAVVRARAGPHTQTEILSTAPQQVRGGPNLNPYAATFMPNQMATQSHPVYQTVMQPYQQQPMPQRPMRRPRY